MNRVIVITTLLTAINILSACSSDEQIEEEVSHVTNEGPYGGHSIQWYKMHWKTETTDQRKWCHRQKKEAVKLMQSCADADIGWKQGWADPETNPPRHWEDGSQLN
jgi:hypothetical protein